MAKELRIRTIVSPQRAAIVIAEHKLIVDSIASRDGRKVIDAVVTHLTNAMKRSGIDIFKEPEPLLYGKHLYLIACNKQEFYPIKVIFQYNPFAWRILLTLRRF